jgi:hypothetical protein
MVVGVGPPATQSREPGQARKGAAAAVEAGAGVWLAQTATPSTGCMQATRMPAQRPLRAPVVAAGAVASDLQR